MLLAQGDVSVWTDIFRNGGLSNDMTISAPLRPSGTLLRRVRVDPSQMDKALLQLVNLFLTPLHFAIRYRTVELICSEALIRAIHTYFVLHITDLA
jgi:hypothetical protein